MKRITALIAAFFLSAGVCLSAPPKLEESNYPRVDGSTSTQALQCLIKSKVLGTDVVVPHSDTGKAYTNLINGATDLILVARAPSTEEIGKGLVRGLQLDHKPVALDALVFLVNASNGVTNLTTDQIRDIYRGVVTRWEQLGKPGVPTGPIQAHTRARFSGSEELMRKLVMKSAAIGVHSALPDERIEPGQPGELYERIGPMGASVRTIADKKLSLTYSVYYYVKNVARLVDVKEKSLADLRRRHSARLKLLDQSGIREKDPVYWAQLKEREREAFSQEEQLVRTGLEDTRRALSGSAQVKMVKVDGVEPSPHTIGSRRYPFATEVYVVIPANEPKDAPSVRLRDWLLTPEGQKLVAESGYVTLASPATATDQALGLTADNAAEALEDNRWNWTVFLKGAPQDIDRVKCVEYTLHPTFPDRVRRVCEAGDPKRPFGLSATGWGTFRIGIRVYMKDGSHKDLEHQLTFSAARN